MRDASRDRRDQAKSQVQPPTQSMSQAKPSSRLNCHLTPWTGQIANRRCVTQLQEGEDQSQYNQDHIQRRNGPPCDGLLPKNTGTILKAPFQMLKMGILKSISVARIEILLSSDLSQFEEQVSDSLGEQRRTCDCRVSVLVSFPHWPAANPYRRAQAPTTYVRQPLVGQSRS